MILPAPTRVLVCGLLGAMMLSSVATAEPELKPNRLGSVTVKGNKHYSTDFILQQFSPVTRQGVIDRPLLERTLRLMNEFMGLSVRAVLRAGKEPGVTDVTLEVEDSRPMRVFVDYNNFGSRLTGENRPGSSLLFGDVTGHGDTFVIRGVMPFPTEQTTPFIQAIYTRPISSRGEKLALSYATGSFNVGQELAVLDIFGSADILGLTYSRALERSTRGQTDLNVSLFQKSFRNFLLGNAASRDEIRALTAGLSGSWLPGNGTASSLEFTITQGLGDSLGGTPAGDPLASRVGASNHFTKFNLNTSHVIKMGKRNFLILRGTGQLGLQPLVIGEQLSVGGPDSVRGFVQNEALGDNGWAVSAEYRIPLNKSGSRQAAVFIDTGAAYLLNAQVGEEAVTTLTGAGVGLRFPVGKNTFVRTDMGFALSPSTNQNGTSSIFYGQISTRY